MRTGHVVHRVEWRILLGRGLLSREPSFQRRFHRHKYCGDHVQALFSRSTLLCLRSALLFLSAVSSLTRSTGRTGPGHIDGMLRSLLISALSACLAVFTTLQYQAWTSVPPSPADTTSTRTPAASGPSVVSDNTEEEAAPADIGQQDDGSTTIDIAQALGLGRVLLARGEADEAALAFRVAYSGASRSNHKGEAKHGLGLALRAAGRPDEALEACREAELLDPQLAVASACIGALLTEAGDGAGALEALRSAAEKVDDAGPENADVNGRLGAALVAAGEVDEAIPVLRRALAAAAGSVGGDAGRPHVAYNLGVAWQSKVRFYY